jgi:hypothetical protein
MYRRPVVKTIVESLLQHDEKHVVQTPLRRTKIRKRRLGGDNNCIIFFTTGLEAAILETQKVLRSAVSRTQNGDALNSLSSADGDDARHRLEHLVSKGL